MTTATETPAVEDACRRHFVEPVLGAETVEAIRAEAKRFQQRFGLWPPETHEWPCDLHEQWAREWLEANRGVLDALLKDASPTDFTTLLTEVFKEDIWTSNRRAFFAALHKLAIKREEAGHLVSAELIRFYRDRYNPPHRFTSERTPLHRDPLFVPPIFQRQGEISDDEE